MGSQPCADVASSSTKSPIVIRDIQSSDLDRAGLTDYWFLSAASGLGRDLELATLREAIHRSETISGWLRFWAESPEGFGLLLVEPKPWDSELLSVPTGNLFLATTARDGLSRKEIAAALLASLLRNNSPYQYLVARTAAEDVALVQALEENGFRFIVPMATLGRDCSEAVQVKLPPGVKISSIRPEQVESVGSLAAEAFQWGRFSADILMPRHVGFKVHEIWAKNCALGIHAARTLVARRDEELFGFVALKFLHVGDKKIGSIELIATSPSARGVGLGRALVRSACNWIRKESQQVIVRTELPNTRALRMYEAEGFRMLNGSLYLTRWAQLSGNRE